jgi:hypothetical protein
LPTWAVVIRRVGGDDCLKHLDECVAVFQILNDDTCRAQSVRR